MRMPEPIATCFDDGYWIAAKTEAGRKFNDRRTSQLVYDKQALIDLLEEAAKELERTEQKAAGTWGVKWTVPLYGTQAQCVRAIRKLKETL